MEEIVKSLKQFKYCKEIRGLLNRISCSYDNEYNLSHILLQLYEEDLLGKSEFVVLRSKMMMNRYVALMNKTFPGLKHGIYLYENDTRKLWNGSVSNVPAAYNEYTQGLCVKNDILSGFNSPVYVQESLSIEDVENSEHAVCRNHRKPLLQSGVYAFCTIPLQYNNKSIGHKVFYSERKKNFSELEIKQYQIYCHLLEKELISVKDLLIREMNDEQPS